MVLSVSFSFSLITREEGYRAWLVSLFWKFNGSQKRTKFYWPEVLGLSSVNLLCGLAGIAIEFQWD